MKEIRAVSAFLNALTKEFESGHAQEHSYRPALKGLFEDLTKLQVINEPKGSAHGRPDFIFLKSDIPIAYAEAKDITVNLKKVEKSEQMARYFGYANLVLTNGIEFRFYKNGEKYGDPIFIAEIQNNTIESKEEHFANLVDRLTDFIAKPIDTIRSAEHLAKIMGGKARRLRDNIAEMLNPSFAGTKGEEIEKILHVLKERLIHDLTEDEFADLYAQTLVYGLFVARYHDDTPEDFSRREACERIPASNHLLQQFFEHIAGTNFEKKLSFIVDELCDVFVHADVKSLVHGLYQKKGDVHDPIIHFYEDFLSEYDPALRKKRGVFYTPLPVVKYIVRSVDKILQEHFGLAEGLADRAQIEWKYTEQGKKFKKQIDRVQVLDPAVGTGTFLHEVILNIYERFKGQEGAWEQYVNDHLLPRLHGFELMMASYTIAHLKISMTLAETGVTDFHKRLRIFLTNSLEEAPEKDDTLFRGLGLDGALTEEALAAEEVKRDLPIMVVLGNPPYSGISQNNGEWISGLIQDYLKEPGGKEKLKERKHWLNDDYVKFIRFSESLIEKNGDGIVAMITNHGYLENLTFRGMRWHLLDTFNEIYIIDLHGNSVKKERAPNGGKDENVFDIQQGVAIIVAIRKKAKKGLGRVYRKDCYGLRKQKYEWLETNDVSMTKWQEIELQEPLYLFAHSNYEFKEDYDTGLKISELFAENVTGIVTMGDSFIINEAKEILHERLSKLVSGAYTAEKLKLEFSLGKNYAKWVIESAADLEIDENKFVPIAYRPFDNRVTYFDSHVVWRCRDKIMKHFVLGKNLGLILNKTHRCDGYRHSFVVNTMADFHITETAHANPYLFPLYLYPDSKTVEGEKRIPNFNMELLQPVLKKLGLTWVEDGTGNGKDSCGPEDIFDYIYAALHSPTYRERYKEFLKIDFPRVPFTKDKKVFWKLVELGREIRLLHLMESPKLSTLITKYPVAGSNEVEKLKYEESVTLSSSKGDSVGKIWINKEQYFDGVPKEAWEFPIGGYQPAQKWLKDRKGRTLNSDDILHYQKMIVALVETGRLMKEVDTITSALFT